MLLDTMVNVVLIMVVGNGMVEYAKNVGGGGGDFNVWELCTCKA